MMHDQKNTKLCILHTFTFWTQMVDRRGFTTIRCPSSP